MTYCPHCGRDDDSMHGMMFSSGDEMWPAPNPSIEPIFFDVKAAAAALADSIDREIAALLGVD